MKKLNLWLLAALFTGALSLVSCSSSDDENTPATPSEPEVPAISEIDYELSETAIVVPANVSNQISNFDATAHTFTLPANIAINQVPIEGQCLIVNTPSETLPDGLLAKVSSVKQTGNGYEITYEDAELGDAFKTIDIPEQAIPLGDYVQHVYDADGNEVKFEKVWDTRASGNTKVKIQLPEKGWDLPLGLSFTPKMTVDMMLKYVMQFNDYKPVYVASKVDADVEVGADLSLGLVDKKVVDYHATLLTIICGAIPVGPVVITPTIDIHAIFQVGGGVSIEASVSYKRTLHAKAVYQDGAGITASAELEPEAPDAWTFTFGPKLEGYMQYGLGVGPHIAIYAKALGIGCLLNVTKKESISQKFDLAAYTEGKWEFLTDEPAQYSASLNYELRGYLQAMGKPIKEFDGPELSIPLDSRPVFPRFQIVRDEFMKIEDGIATLKMTMKEKGLLYGKYRVEFHRADLEKDPNPIVEYFNFDDAKRAELEAGEEVDITCKASLRDDYSYFVNVYYEYGNLALLVHQVQPEVLKISMITVMGELYGTEPQINDGAPHKLTLGGAFMSSSGAKFTVTPKGKRTHIKAETSEANYNIVFECDIDDIYALSNKKAKLENVKLSRTWNFDRITSGITMHMEGEQTYCAESLSMTSDNNWESTGATGLNITEFKYHSKQSSTDDDDEPTILNYSYYPSEFSNFEVSIYFVPNN